VTDFDDDDDDDDDDSKEIRFISTSLVQFIL